MTTFKEICKDVDRVDGMMVLPWKELTPENMDEWMVGLRVTIGLSGSDGTPTKQGHLRGFDAESLKIEVGGKVKKFPYAPSDICLNVYQFQVDAVLRSNPEEAQLKAPAEVVREKEAAVIEEPTPVKNDPPVLVRKPRKPRKSAPAPTEKPTEKKPDMAAQLAEKAKARAAEKKKKKASKTDDPFGIMKALQIMRS